MATLPAGTLLLALIHTGCDIAARPDGSAPAWVRVDNPFEEMAGVACSEKRIVAVGWGVLTSTDGLSWTPARVPPEWRLKRVAWGRSLFVAVGHTVPGPGRQIAATSPDGVTWKEEALSGASSDIAWSGDLFVAMGYRTIHTSRDGAQWSARDLSIDPKLGGLSGVAWGGSRFVGVGGTLVPKGDFLETRALIFTSTDGVTWSEQKAPGAGLKDVAWSGERFVAVGRSILTSQDGSTWSEQRAPVEEINLTDVAWSGTQFAAVGTVVTAGPGIGLLMTSPDGVTWTRSPAPSRRIEPAAVAWCGSRFIAVGAHRRGWFADYTKGLILRSP